MYAIGLMSGTSLDGIDAVLAEFSPQGQFIRSVHSKHRPMADELRADLLVLQAPSPNELAHAQLASLNIAKEYCAAVRAVLSEAGMSPSQIGVLGAHGQTIRHQPASGYSVQLLNAAALAHSTGIRVAYDFRARDICAGGQGAPLVPAFHRQIFSAPSSNTSLGSAHAHPVTRTIVNIGGISNLTWLSPNQPVIGFDCGPGNVLLDLWCEQHLGQRFDALGAWAASAEADESLLKLWLGHEYFSRPYPKSTGRDDFHGTWLQETLNQEQAQRGQVIAPAVVQATLCRLTASVIAKDCLALGADEVYVCGGGAYNLELMRQLRDLTQRPVQSTAALGVPPDQVEALAFAWLGVAALLGLAGNLPEVTGAQNLQVLGSLTAQ
jgi:anhydro-N-acetylmuramic acid kinase